MKNGNGENNSGNQHSYRGIIMAMKSQRSVMSASK
jgi:hypothetical protein